MPYTRPGLLVVAAVSLLLSACGSTGDHQPANSADSGSQATGPISANPVKATGQPIKIGFVSNGKSAALDMSADHVGATAAKDYANNYLGGIAGRPVDLEICDDNNTPAGATNCANNLIQ